MRGTADKAGRSLGLAVVGGLVLVCAAALMLHVGTALELDIGALALGGATAALIGVVVILRDLGRGRAQQDKVSEELDLLSQTLLRIETSLAALDGSGTRASSTLNDVAGDVHSLSQVVKSLAEAMAAQDREIGALKQRGATEMPLSYRSGAGPDPLATPPSLIPSMVPTFLPAQEAATAALSEALPAVAPAAKRTDENGAILAAASAGEIDLHVQPIVNLPQRRERLYEVLPLLHGDGAAPLLPAQYLPALERAGRLPSFEIGMVTKALVFAHRLATLGSDARVSVHLSNASLADRGFLRRLDAVIEDHEAASRRLVVEVEQAAWKEIAAESDVFARMRRHGVSFALRAITDENLNPPALVRLGVKHVRLTVKRLLAAIDAEGIEADLVTLVGALSRSGIDVVADGVEDEVVVPELIDIGVPLAQGLAFALPCPADIVLEQPRRAATGQKAAPSTEPPKPDGSGPPQGSLRDFLRRAG
jgi:cyclic-di-GMP phosphodiesterase TipF (flagellum assembly factor)